LRFVTKYNHHQTRYFLFNREESPFPVRHGSAGGISKVVAVPHGPAATSETITKEIHQRMIGRQQQQIRDELFGVDDQETSGKKLAKLILQRKKWMFN